MASCVARVPSRHQRTRVMYAGAAGRCVYRRSVSRSSKGVTGRWSFGNTNRATTAAGWGGSPRRLCRMQRAGTSALTVPVPANGRSTMLAGRTHLAYRSTSIGRTGRGAFTTCSRCWIRSMDRCTTHCVDNCEDETYSISRADRVNFAHPLPRHWINERPHTRVATFARQAY